LLKNKSIEIIELNESHARQISDLLLSEDKDYSKYFIPFDFDYETIQNILKNKKYDKYYGLFVNKTICGFYMLRGFDEGYQIPSYGVWISKAYSNKGLSTLTLFHAISFCKVNNIPKLMRKVHPENTIAKSIYERFGFKQKGTDPVNNNVIYYKDI